MVDYNNTYLQNSDYPRGYGDKTSITYQVNKINGGKITFSYYVLL
jgi:hypothetical protein